MERGALGLQLQPSSAIDLLGSLRASASLNGPDLRARVGVLGAREPHEPADGGGADHECREVAPRAHEKALIVVTGA